MWPFVAGCCWPVTIIFTDPLKVSVSGRIHDGLVDPLPVHASGRPRMFVAGPLQVKFARPWWMVVSGSLTVVFTWWMVVSGSLTVVFTRSWYEYCLLVRSEWFLLSNYKHGCFCLLKSGFARPRWLIGYQWVLLPCCEYRLLSRNQWFYQCLLLARCERLLLARCEWLLRAC